MYFQHESLESNANAGPEFGSSDHKTISLNVNLGVYKENVSKGHIYKYRKDNFEKLRKKLADTDRSIVENKTDIDDSFIHNILNGIVKLYVPAYKIRSHIKLINLSGGIGTLSQDY